jgi:hypothetical protein
VFLSFIVYLRYLASAKIKQRRNAADILVILGDQYTIVTEQFCALISVAIRYLLALTRHGFKLNHFVRGLGSKRR